jgi:hypothetical protein
MSPVLLFAAIFFFLGSIIFIEYRLVDKVASRVSFDPFSVSLRSRFAATPQPTLSSVHSARQDASTHIRTTSSSSSDTTAEQFITPRRKTTRTTTILSHKSSSSSTTTMTTTASSTLHSSTTSSERRLNRSRESNRTTSNVERTTPLDALRAAAESMQSSLTLSPALPVSTTPVRTVNVRPASGWPTMPGAPAEYTIAQNASDGEVGRAKGGAGFNKFTVEQMDERMDLAETSGHVRYQYPVPARPRDANNVKIFGLVAVRNVEDNIALFLELLSNFTGSVFYFYFILFYLKMCARLMTSVVQMLSSCLTTHRPMRPYRPYRLSVNASTSKRSLRRANGAATRRRTRTSCCDSRAD